jgi:thiosulfate/3-mercaptopyruvate sulfurtransferase
MNTELLVSAYHLAELIAEEECVVIDCRFDLGDTAKGREDFLSGHIPCARYAHLDEDLSSALTDTSGRHPLPEADKFARFLSSAGWREGQLLVAHDGGGNAVASRLWWLMRYFGQPSALLDGGLNAWTEQGLPLEAGAVPVSDAPVPELRPDPSMTVSTEDVMAALGGTELSVLDARASERYSGEIEPLDTRAGHIPGALNRPQSENLDENGRFKSPERLRAEFEAVLGGIRPETIAHSCGSGVTACHNLFAMELAGLKPGRLYPGSWSQWIRDESRPIETGG